MTLPVHAPELDVALHTTARLLRNYADMPYVPRLTPAQREEILRRVYTVLDEEETVFDVRDTQKTDANLIAALNARGILPPYPRDNHVVSFVDREENVSVTLFSEEHIAAMGILPGLRTIGASQLAFRLERRLAQEHPYAFDPQWGYLTASIRTLGTGLKCRTVLHLPALWMENQIPKTIKRAAAEKLIMRPLYRWTGKPMVQGAPGAFYVVENLTTLGKSEADIRETLQNFTMELIEEERAARDLAQSDDDLALQDALMRAWGEMLHARLMSADDLVCHLSQIRYAVCMGYLHGSLSGVDRLLTSLRPGAVCVTAQNEMTPRECDIFRAEYAREILQKTLTE